MVLRLIDVRTSEALAHSPKLFKKVESAAAWLDRERRWVGLNGGALNNLNVFVQAELVDGAKVRCRWVLLCEKYEAILVGPSGVLARNCTGAKMVWQAMDLETAQHLVLEAYGG